MEIHEMDIISINKTMTKESKQMNTKIFVCVVALKKAIFSGSIKSLPSDICNVTLHYDEQQILPTPRN